MLRWTLCAGLLCLACTPAPGAADATDAVDAKIAPQPKLVVQPPTLDFNAALPNTPTQQTLQILNQGDAPLICNSFAFKDDDNGASGFTIDQLGTESHIAPSADETILGDSFVVPVAGVTVSVSFAATDFLPHSATLTLFCNDPAYPNGLAIAFEGVTVEPCIQLSPTAIDFGGVVAGTGQDSKPVTVTSCGSGPLCLTGVDLSESGTTSDFTLNFSAMKAICATVDPAIGPTKDAPCCVPAGAQTSFKVTYAPVAVSPADPNIPGQFLADTATIHVSSNAQESPPSSVLVSGVGVSDACPIAQIAIIEGDEVVPQTVLHLEGDGSIGSGGAAIQKWSWTAQQPAGSAQGFTPTASFPNPTFLPNAAGEYTFCLDVTDTDGVKSCVKTCQQVLVVPNDAVHVELLWDTPADPDQTDTGPDAGADLDLHFASYLASGPDLDCDGTGDPWFNNPFDCFWFNSSPQWGSTDPAIQDDPTLDLDDSDGAGPENLNLQAPEGTPDVPRFYSIGVHYWNDHGFGVSYATVTVYLFGAVALKLDKVAMNSLDMWYVAKLNWPNQLKGTATPALSVCYQSAPAGPKPGAVCEKAATMWQPKGDWCITPCYVNPIFAATTGGAMPLNCK